MIFLINFFFHTGEVIGVDNRDEDSDRRTIDAAINGLRPHVFPQDYDLAYCDILDGDGNKIGKAQKGSQMSICISGIFLTFLGSDSRAC